MVNCKLLTADDNPILKYQLKFFENGGREKRICSLSLFFSTYIVVSRLEVPVKSLWDVLLN